MIVFDRDKPVPIRPGFVVPVAHCYLVIDRAQPWAATISSGGELVQSLEWSSLLRPPSRWCIPQRRIALLANGLVAVHDLMSNGVVLLDAVRGVIETLGVRDIEHPSLVWQHLPLWRSAEVHRCQAVNTWRFFSHLDRTRWISRAQHPLLSATYSWRDASILAYASLSPTNTLASFQCANKRPWNFRPRFDLRLLDAEVPDTIQDVPMPSFPPTRSWKSDKEVDPSDLHDYFGFSLNQKAVVSGLGSKRTVVAVSGDGSDTSIKLSFELPSYPKLTFIRVDQPYDEIGNFGGGLRDMNVSLAEDVRHGVVDEIVARSYLEENCTDWIYV